MSDTVPDVNPAWGLDGGGDDVTQRQCVHCDSVIPVGAQCRNEACPKVREALSVRVLAEKIAKLEARVAELEKHAIGDGK